MITLDTNTVIYYFNGDENLRKFVEIERQNGEQFVISTITELELLSFPNISPEEIVRLTLWFNEVFILPVDSKVAQKAAEVRRHCHLKTPDAVIAATALLNGGRLITSDKIFKKVHGLKIL